MVLFDELSEVSGLTHFDSTNGAFTSSYYCMSVMLDEALSSKRTEIVGRLKAGGIGTSVYYPRPVPDMTYYKRKYNHPNDRFPVASWISNSSIALPVGPHLDEMHMQTIAAGVKQAIHEVQS